MTTLKHNAVSGIKWSTVSQVGRQGTQLLTTVILARLLAPSDFGLVGMAMVVTGFIGIFKDLGTSSAVIQQQELSDEMLSSIFWVNVGFGALSMCLLFILAPLGAMFYHEPRVTAILQVLSISFFISGSSILHQALLERSLSFKSLAKLELASVIAGAVVGIGLAWGGWGVWSLVFQSLMMVSLSTVLLWISSPWRPRWVFRWAEVKAISGFSLYLTGFSVFNYFSRNADYLLIGRFLGAQDLGYYTLAYRILLFPLQNISAVVGRVTYPIFSSLKENNSRLADAYLKTTGMIAFITIPLMAGVFVLAQPLMMTFFGAAWQPAVLLIKILAPVGLVQSIGTTVGAIYQAKGRTDWMFRWGIGSGLFIVTLLAIGLRWGIVGVATAYAVGTFILLYPSFLIPFRLINLRFLRLLEELRPPFLISGLMVAGLLIWSRILPPLSNMIELILSVGLGVIIYTVASWLMNKKQLQELWKLSTGRNGEKKY